MTPFKIVIFFVVSGYLYAQKQEVLTARKALSLTKKLMILLGKNSLFFMITHHGFKFCRIITTVTKMVLPSGPIKVLVDFSILLIIEIILFLLWQFVKRKVI